MSRLVKIYAVTFMKYTNYMKDVVYNEETDKCLGVGRETFLVKEDDLNKFKVYGDGYKSINYIGNMYIDEENNMSELDTTTTVATGQFRYIPEKGYATTDFAGSTIFKDCPVYESEIDAIENLEPHHQYIVPDKRYLVPEVPTIKVRYHKELCPELIEMEKIDIGDFIDLRSAVDMSILKGDYKLISLGISVQLPKGYHAEVVPRSSTLKNFGIIMANSIGIIDESYCGDNDIWHFPALAMRDTKIHINDRICQFRIVKNRNIKIEVVDKLENEDRGGIGSTGKN